MSNVRRAWQSRRRSVIEFLFAGLIYALLAIIFTWPAAERLSSHLIGRTTDAMVHYWNGWWAGQALLSGQSPFFTPLLNYPEGVSLVTHNFAWTNIIPWLFLSPVIGGIAAYNLIIILFLIFCGLALYLLVRELTNCFPAALVAGIVHMVWPYRLSQLDHPNLVATFFIPLTLLFLTRTIRLGRWRDAVLTGICLALTGYTRWQQLLPMVFILPIYIAGLWSTKEITWTRKQIGQLVTIFAVGGLLLLPPAGLLYQEQQSEDLTADLLFVQDEETMGVDLLAYITPSNRNFFLKETTRPIYENFYPDRSSGRRYPAYIGGLVLIIAVVGLITNWRRTWTWLVMGFILAGLAAGIAIRINGMVIEQIPSLYELLAPLQFLRLMREPERYLMFLALPISVLFGYGWQSLTCASTYRRIFLAATPLLILIIGFTYLALPTQMIAVDYDQSVFAAIRNTGSGAVLNLPLRYRFSKEYMFEQTIHQKPILQGHVSREPDNLYRFLEQAPFFEDIKGLPGNPAYLLAQLQADGIDYVLLSKYLMGEATWRYWQEVVPYEPFYENDRYLAYTTKPGAPVSIEENALAAVPGISLSVQELNSFCSPERMVAAARLQWMAGPAPRPNVDLHLTAEAADSRSLLAEKSLPLIAQWPSADWPEGAITTQAYTLEFPPTAAAAVYGQLVDQASGRAQGPKFLLGQVTEDSCTAMSAGDQHNNIQFGDEITLLTYEENHNNESLTISPIWLAQQRPTANYKVFVHLLEPDSCTVAAQIDFIPQQWQFPTIYWQAGEIVADKISLDLSHVRPGTYRLSTGLYDADSGERLPVIGSASPLEIINDDCSLLPEEVTIFRPLEN